MTSSSPFSSVDYVIIALTLLTSACIGLYYRFTGGKQKTTEEYLLADRSLTVFPVAISFVTTYISSITLFGQVAEYYSYGSQFAFVMFGYLWAIPATAYIYLPVYFKLQKVSTYEYLELRFGSRMRLIGSICYCIQQLLYSSIVLYAPSLALDAVTGLDMNISTALVGLVCTFYATVGGIKAVVTTDILQMFLMFSAVMSIIFVSSGDLGGLNNMWQTAAEHGRTSFNKYSLDPTERNTWWSTIVGAGFAYLSTFAINHTHIQRLLTLNTLPKSQMSLIVSLPFLLSLLGLLWIVGLSLFATYKDCDPVTSGRIGAQDQMLPLYVAEDMKKIPGLLGLFVAGIVSATLSTISGVCNSLSAVVVRDFLPRIANRLKIKSTSAILATKLSSMTFGLLTTFLALFAGHLGGLLSASGIVMGVIGGPLLGVFTLGMFTTTVNETGATSGLVIAVTFLLWINLGGPRPPNPTLPVSLEGCTNSTINAITSTISTTTEYFYLYRICYLWTSLIGFSVTMVFSYIISWWIPGKHPWECTKKASSDGRETKENLLNPDLFSPFLASKIRRMNEKVFNDKKRKEETIPLTRFD